MTQHLIGQLIGNRYQLTYHISEGGYGNVFKAVDTQLNNEEVAVKVLRSPPPDMDQEYYQNLRERFLDEARVSAMLGEHPSIVQVKSYGVHNKQPYLVMEYLSRKPIEGQGLDVILGREKCLAPDRVVRIAEQVCEALHHAHCFNVNLGRHSIRGVIHRDIKPSNIFLLRSPNQEESIKLLDFGISKLISDNSKSLTQAGYFLGTKCYASPEQMRAERLDARSDIYSLGVVLYELLTGHLPFTPETDTLPGWYHVHNHERPHPFRQFATPYNSPKALQAIVLSCLEKDPNARPQTMLQLKEQLQAVIIEASSKASWFQLPFMRRRAQEQVVSPASGPPATAEDPPTLTHLSPHHLSSTTQKPSIDAEYEVAVELIEQGKYKSAIQLLNRMIQIEPNEYKYYFRRGIAHLRQHNWGMAQIDFQGALRLDPDNREALQGLKNATSQKVDKPAGLPPAEFMEPTVPQPVAAKELVLESASRYARLRALVIWGLACIIGSGAGRLVFLGLVQYLPNTQDLSILSLLFYTTLFTLVMGICVAIPQWIALRIHLNLPQLDSWLIAVPLGYTVGALSLELLAQVGPGASSLMQFQDPLIAIPTLNSPWAAGVLGSTVGFLQWLSLRRQLHAPLKWWIPFTIADFTVSASLLGLMATLANLSDVITLAGLAALCDCRLLSGAILIRDSRTEKVTLLPKRIES